MGRVWWSKGMLDFSVMLNILQQELHFYLLWSLRSLSFLIPTQGTENHMYIKQLQSKHPIEDPHAASG